MTNKNQEIAPATPESRTLVLLWYAGLVLAALLRIVLIDRHGLWNNELITYRVLVRGYGDIIAERLSVNHMPLYFLMEKAWTDAFGTSEASMRAIGAFFGWMMVWASGRLARRLGGLRLAVPVVFAAAVQQLWLSTSLEARMYSMLSWAAIESTDAWFAWARGGGKGVGAGRRGDLVRWVLVTVLGIYVHMLYGVVIALQMVDAAVRWRRQGLSPLRLLPAWLAVAVLCIPISVAWAVNQSKFDNSASDLEFRTPGVLLRSTLNLLWGDYRSLDTALPRILSYLLFLCVVAGLVGLLRGRQPGHAAPVPKLPDDLRDLRALGCGYLLFLAGLYLAQAFSSSSMLSEERYYAPLFPAVLIVGVAALVHLALRSRFGAAAAALALLLQIGVTGVYYGGVGEGLREGVETVFADMAEDRGLVCVMSGGGMTGVEAYYGRRLPARILELDRSEKSLGKVQRQIDRYASEFPEFWVLTYHEKEDTVWNVLERPRSGYVALTDERTYGKTKVRLFSRSNSSAASADPAEPGS